jgi:hypothetical protein
MDRGYGPTLPEGKTLIDFERDSAAVQGVDPRAPDALVVTRAAP